jgi:hypothetical protein
LRILAERPSERASSGSFLDPNSRTTTTTTINQCMGENSPTILGSFLGPVRGALVG